MFFFVGNSTIFYVKEKEEILNVRGKKKKRIVMQPALACMYILMMKASGEIFARCPARYQWAHQRNNSRCPLCLLPVFLGVYYQTPDKKKKKKVG